MLRRKLLSVSLLCSLFIPSAALIAQTTSATARVGGGTVYAAPVETIDRIKEEGSKNSQAMQTLSYLTDVIGARLTGSQVLKRANEWTRDQMTKWGMQNAHLEAWGPFGRGWKLNNFNAQIVAPYDIPLQAYPKAWSPSTKGAVTSDVVFLDIKTEADFEKYKGKLKNKIVLVSQPREVKAVFEPLGERYTDEQLNELASYDPAKPPRPAARQFTPEEIQKARAERDRQRALAAKLMSFLVEERAAIAVDNSRAGSGGTIFVQQASVAQDTPVQGKPAPARINPQSKEAERRMIPQMTLATENYNRLARMIQAGEQLKMTAVIDAAYEDKDPMAYNTVAEIPGTDLKDEVVMLGGHLDSWHAGTGATDNAAGCAVAMEAARIIQALRLKPRRTIRVALWTGEEQGIYGSEAYVKQHFGEMQGRTQPANGQPGNPGTLVKQADYEKLSAYYNLDNGTGRIRGVYMQGNAAVRPYFERWLAPFADLKATTLTLQNTGGTDHLSFDAIGLPGFQFIQDEIEYDTRTHHSNQDNYDRIQADDMKQAATVMAAFVYQTAMMNEKLPRKTMK
jgi:carboxypeptidase Q